MDHYYLEDSPIGQWVPDVMAGFKRRTLPLGEDNEGPISATLVRRDPPLFDAAKRLDTTPILYLHGWSDYFYNVELADFMERAGYRFYALDLRKYGRSLRPWHTPGLIDTLKAYHDEIRMALAVIENYHPNRKPVLMAHSTGALTAALWADAHPGQVAGLVLNAPWLELQGNSLIRGMATALVEPLSKLASGTSTMNLPKSDLYWRTLSNEADGDWFLNPRWRPRYSFEVPRVWLSAVMAGHRKVAAGLTITEPILVLTAEKTTFTTTYSPSLQAADVVIDVKVTADRAAHLGPEHTLLKLPGTMHDVYASPKPYRHHAMQRTVSWLNWKRMERRSHRQSGGHAGHKF